jgi:hypothetical protein
VPGSSVTSTREGGANEFVDAALGDGSMEEGGAMEEAGFTVAGALSEGFFKTGVVGAIADARAGAAAGGAASGAGAAAGCSELGPQPIKTADKGAKPDKGSERELCSCV